MSRGPRREAAAQGATEQSRVGVPPGLGRGWPAQRDPGCCCLGQGNGGDRHRRRRLGAARRAEGEDARALPEMGSEVLGTERGTRPATGPLSTANSISGKCEPGGGPGPGRGRAAEAGIFGSAWPPGGAHPTVSAQGRGAAGLRPTRFSAGRFGLRRQTRRNLAPPLREETNGSAGFLLRPMGVSGAQAALRRPGLVEAELDPGVGGSSSSQLGCRPPSCLRAKPRKIPV